MKRIKDLSEAEILALAITAEEEDARTYRHFASRLRAEFPATADMFLSMATDEQSHKNALLDLYQQRFGSDLPLISRADVKGFMPRRSVWLLDKLPVAKIRAQAQLMEEQAAKFYQIAASQTTDTATRKLLGDLALVEAGHADKAAHYLQDNLTPAARADEDAVAKRRFLLQIVQPGLTGLIDGSISTLAPIFAAAFATHNSHDAFVVGLAASIGSGISMGITEGMSDDGQLTGRGHPWLRGSVCGLMTTLGGLGHTLPYLINDFWTATAVAAIVVLLELLAISWIRWKYMDTPFGSAMIQVFLGGVLVLMTGILIGGA